MNKVLTAVRGHFIDDLKSVWKKFSVWAYVAIISLPDLYHMAGEQGLFTLETVPDKFKWLVRVAGAVGLYLRLVSQTAKTLQEANQPKAE